MRAFFSPSRYRFGYVAASLAAAYLGLTGLLILGAIDEGMGDGAFMWGFVFMATMPLSLGVMFGYSAVATANGVPMAEQDAGWWTLWAFAACALVNAVVFWVICRGRRIRVEEPEPA